MKKKVLKVVLTACMAVSIFALTACGGSSSLRFLTGGESGTYYAVGNVIANDISNNTDVSVSALVGSGSQSNLEALRTGDAEMAFTQSDVMAYAYDGTNLFEEDGAISNFSVLGALYMEQVQIVTCDPDIKTVADLAGKNVSVGSVGSGVYFNAIDILGANGLTLDDIAPTYQSFSDSADSLQNGQIDAAFVVAGAPTTAITNLSTNKQAYLVSLDDEHIEALIASSPYYSKNVIEAGTYTGIDEDVTTVAVAAVIVVSDDLDEDTVYAMTAELFDNLEALESSHAKFAEMSIEFGASVTSVPYHAGAAKYFEEQGYTVATK